MENAENVIEAAETKSEPLQVDELVAATLQDLVFNNPPSDLVSEFIEDFILIDRAETAQDYFSRGWQPLPVPQFDENRIAFSRNEMTLKGKKDK